MSWLHWEERSSPGEPNSLLAIQTAAGSAEKNHFLGCHDPQAGEESWDWETKPAAIHMKQGRELLGHLRVVCSWTLLQFHSSSVFSWVFKWSLTANPFYGNLSFPALWKTDTTSFLENCSPLLSWPSPHSPHNLLFFWKGTMIHFSWIKYDLSLNLLLGLIPSQKDEFNSWEHSHFFSLKGNKFTTTKSYFQQPKIQLWSPTPHAPNRKIHQGIVELGRKSCNEQTSGKLQFITWFYCFCHQEVILEISCILYFGCAKFIFHSC